MNKPFAIRLLLTLLSPGIGLRPAPSANSEIQEMLTCVLVSLGLLALVGYLVYLGTEKRRRPGSAPYDSQTLPKGLTVQETRTGLIVRKHTPLLTRLLSLAFTSLVLSVAIREIVSGGNFAGSRYGLLNIPVIVLFIYVGLAFTLNTTTLQAEGELLTAKHGPIPMPGNRQVPLREIGQLYCRERVRRSHRSIGPSYSYALYAVMRDTDEKIQLLTFKKAAQARYVEQQLERYLGIQDAPVTGEFPK